MATSTTPISAARRYRRAYYEHHKAKLRAYNAAHLARTRMLRRLWAVLDDLKVEIVL